jgi:signal transduction histidine kinase
MKDVLHDSPVHSELSLTRRRGFQKILVVEDEPISAADLAEQLQRLGYEVAGPVASGEKALALAEELQPDLVLMDIHLQGEIDGVEAATELSQRHDIPVIFLTAFDDAATLERAKQAEPYGYLLKPFEMRNVRTTLEMAAHKHQAIVERRRAEARLAEANRELLQKHTEIQNFYHTLSHELKTPLTAAREFVSILMEGMAGALNPTQMEYLGIVHESHDQLLTNINDLLDSTRLETGKFSVAFKPGSLGEVVQRVVTLLAPAARGKSICLQGEVQPGLPATLFDHTRIAQVLTNLVTNALKFTAEGGSIDVRAVDSADHPGFLEVSVQDTGCGIPEKHLGRIFERLYQVLEDENAPPRGLGLGLYLCKELVRLHGGQITVRSQVGRGSTFTFHLPKTTLDTQPQLLVVDDDPGIRDILQQLLTNASYQVTVADSGESAVEAMKNKRPALVLLDLAMPGTDGSAALSQIRRAWGKVPVIIHTGHPEGDLMNRALAHSPFTVLAKPCPVPQLLETVRKILKQEDTTIFKKLQS